MAGSVVDIDAQRRAEEALRQSEERYAIAMTGSDEAHWVWNVKTDELYSSPTAASTAPGRTGRVRQRRAPSGGRACQCTRTTASARNARSTIIWRD